MPAVIKERKECRLQPAEWSDHQDNMKHDDSEGCRAPNDQGLLRNRGIEVHCEYNEQGDVAGHETHYRKIVYALLPVP